MEKTLKTVSKANLHIVGAEPAGVTRKVASSLGRQIMDAFNDSGKQVRLKGMRFIPSTRVDLGHGSFQVMANTVVEISGPTGGSKRAESVDSVLTVGREKKTGQILRTVKIPSLQRATNEAV